MILTAMTREAMLVPMVDEDDRTDGSRYGGISLAFAEEGEAAFEAQLFHQGRALCDLADRAFAEVSDLEAGVEHAGLEALGTLQE